ncbi:MAG: hypothetical protein A2854_00325 [Parcubacteria group bacterium RIFCSPHIGHO2_01_FULL_56_18]|nr:MAG: hypothetical protein A2854_00325 [Parcubacteria group bacterium RIFCSPHIGHO2_01_FULL_56_18]
MDIVFDLGGTNMRIASADRGVIGEVHKVPTPRDPQEAIAGIVRLATAAAGGPIANIVGCSRWFVIDGIFQKGDDILPGWGDFPLAKELSRMLGAPVRIVHDTAAAGVGEVHHGAGKGSAICAYITVSTGVGGDRIVDGTIDRSTFNPEVGRQLIDGVELGDLISGTAVRKKYDIEPKDLADEDIRNGLADILATGLYNTVMHWSPDTIVLGGSMIVGMNPIPIARAEASLRSMLKHYLKAPAVKMAQLGDNGGLIGAAILAERALSTA